MKPFLILSLLATSALMQAAQIDVSQAKKIVQDLYYELHIDDAGRNIEIITVSQDERHLVPAYYVCEVKDKEGFFIISGHERESMLLGYSEAGHYADVLQFRPLNDLLQNYAECADSGLSDDSSKALNTPMMKAPAAIISPLLKTFWAQVSPYNNLCPEIDGEHMLTGCTATTMAQVIFYHRFPDNPMGTGRATLEWKHLDDINFSDYTFDWDQMLLTYKNVEYTEDQANAVAELMLLCGFGVSMNYTPTGSGSYVTKALGSLIQNFGYSATSRIYLRDSYTRDNWLEKIRTELKAGRPIIYGGRTDSYAGHTFVCDGMGIHNTVHINWGWGEGYNMNVDVDVLSLSGTNDGYTYEAKAIMGLQPAIDGEDRNMLHNFDICDSLVFKTSNNMIIIPAVYNNEPEQVTLSIGFLVQKDGETLDPIIMRNDISIPTEAHSQPIYTIMHFPSEWEDGTYTLKMAVHITEAEEWIPVHGGDIPTCLQFSVTEGNVSYEGQTSIQSVAIEPIPTVYDSQTFDLFGRKVSTTHSGQVILQGGRKRIIM